MRSASSQQSGVPRLTTSPAYTNAGTPTTPGGRLGFALANVVDLQPDELPQRITIPHHALGPAARRAAGGHVEMEEREGSHT